MPFKYIIIIFLLIIFEKTMADNDVFNFNTESTLESSFYETSGAYETDIIDKINFYRTHKLYLRKSSALELSDIPEISYISAIQIVDFLEKYSYVTYAMLDDSLDLSVQQELLLEACTTLDLHDYKEDKNNYQYRIRNKHYLNEIDAYLNDKFIGNKLDLYQRFSYIGNNFKAGVLMDKDMGEKNINDFTSLYLSYSKEAKKIIIGDYCYNIGTGSLFGKSFPSRKGSDVINSANSFGRGLKVYKSSIDYNFFRGIAGDFSFQLFDSYALKISQFISYKKRSANIDTIDNIAKSVYQTGLFRTDSEISKHYTLPEFATGNIIEISNNGFIIGLANLYLKYDYPIQSASKRVFIGKEGLLSSIYALYSQSSFSMATEITKDAKDNISYRLQGKTNLDKVKLSLNYRYMPAEFRSPFASTFGEMSNPANEEGIYLGAQWKYTSQIKQVVYYDIYRSIERTYYVPVPISGNDLFSETTYNINKKNCLLLRLKTENKTDAKRNENKEYDIFNTRKSYIRLDLRQVFINFYLRYRLEFCYMNSDKIREDELGIMSFVEVGFALYKDLNISSRLAVFDTDSYSSALWAYEYAMPGYLRTSALFKKGLRYTLNLKYKFLQSYTLNLRYELNYKPNEENLGSGYMEVEGNNDSRIFFQLDLNY